MAKEKTDSSPPVGLSGRKTWIKLAAASRPGDSKTEFVGLNSADPPIMWHATIERDKWVEVPVEVAEHMQSLTMSVKDGDPDDIGAPMIEVQRFVMSGPVDKPPKEVARPQRLPSMV